MKKFVVAVLFLGTVSIVNAQTKVPAKENIAVNRVTPPAIGDLDETSTVVTNTLGAKLALEADQKTALFDEVKGFLEEKKTILALATSNPSLYNTSFGKMQSGLFNRLKGVMGAQKYASFLAMKPNGSASADVLNNLFY